jgi:hypothetical protein
LPVKTSTAQPLEPKMAISGTDQPAEHESTRPRAAKTLSSTIKSLFPTADLDEQAIQSIIAALQKQGTVGIDGTKVSYPGLA